MAGLKIGDEIVSVNGHAVTMNNIENLIGKNAGNRVTLVVERAGHDLTLHATPVNGQTIKVNGQLESKKSQGYIGIGLSAGAVRSSVLGARAGVVRQNRGDRVGRRARDRARLFAGGVLQPLPSGRVAGGGGEPPFPTDPSRLDRRCVRLGVQGAQAGTGELLRS
jgi:membrane-associated protease RseP (regulator of RpoE activity)